MRWNVTGLITSNNKFKVRERVSGQAVAEKSGGCVPYSRIVGKSCGLKIAVSKGKDEGEYECPHPFRGLIRVSC